MNSKYLFTAFLLLTLGMVSEAHAQRNFTLYHLEGTPQTHYMNASFRPSSNVYASLPLGMQSVGVSHSGFTMNDLFQPRSQDDSLEIRPDKAIEKMAALNHINVDVQNELLGFGFRIKDNYFSFAAINRFQFNFLYPKDLFKLALEGNGRDFLGERASFDEMGLNVNSYVEYGFGYNRIISEDLMLGARVKFISGIANIHTARSVLGLHTHAETFDLTIDGSARVNSSNTLGLSYLDEDENNDFSPQNYAYNFENFGLGFDLGGSYVVNEKIMVSASVNDLGFINWKSNTRNFESNEIDYTYRGVDFSGFFADTTDVFERMADSLEQVFSQEENYDSYNTSLYTRFYVGGRYLLTDKIGATVLMYNEIVNKKYRAGLHIGANIKLGEWLSASMNYGYYGRSWTNIGAGFSLRGGPVQWYVGMDNIMGAIHPESQKNFHFTTGLSLMFGKPDKEKDLGTVKFK